eukprot:m.58226 g.58226  ORF g.58226 m.58226 type:complete len:70 (-) comp11665_c1_seq1:67-276(-)
MGVNVLHAIWQAAVTVTRALHFTATRSGEASQGNRSKALTRLCMTCTSRTFAFITVFVLSPTSLTTMKC